MVGVWTLHCAFHLSLGKVLLPYSFPTQEYKWVQVPFKRMPMRCLQPQHYGILPRSMSMCSLGIWSNGWGNNVKHIEALAWCTIQVQHIPYWCRYKSTPPLEHEIGSSLGGGLIPGDQKMQLLQAYLFTILLEFLGLYPKVGLPASVR